MTAPPCEESLVRLAATDSALGCTQREVWRVVDAWQLQHIADVIELLALELVSVAVGRSRSADHPACYPGVRGVRLVWLRFQLVPEGLVITTWDSNPRPPGFRRPGSAGRRDEGELYYVPMLAEAWDFYPSGGGKVVWCELRIPPAEARQLPRRIHCPQQETRPVSVADIHLLERVLDGLRRLDTR